MDTLTSRLRARMDKLEIKPATVADMAGVGRSFVYDILRGKSANPTSEKLSRVAQVLKTDVAWLLHGGDTEAERIEMAAQGADYIGVPFVKVEASMGGGAVVDDHEEVQPWYFNRDWLRVFLRVTPNTIKLLRVTGDSMEPTLRSQDVVMIDTAQILPSPPGVFVLYDGLGLVAKRVEHIQNTDPPVVRIISDNELYTAYERTAEEIRIAGRIVWIARQL